MILAGTFKAGEKLPTERELAEQLNTSRPSVRAALAKLEYQGLITRVQGDGTYVSDKIHSTFAQPLLELFSDNEHFKYDMLEYRHAIEESCCYFAAIRGTDEDKDKIQQKYKEWVSIHESKTDPAVEAKADLAFHLAIAEASHNVVFPHIMNSANELIHQSVTMNLKALAKSDYRRKIIFDDHTNMLDAILEGDGDRARQAVGTHLTRVKTEIEKADILSLRDHKKQFNKDLLKSK